MTTRDDYARAVMPGAADATAARAELDAMHMHARSALDSLRLVGRLVERSGYVRRSCLALALACVEGLLRVVEWDLDAMRSDS
jgi:hypothetical protein